MKIIKEGKLPETLRFECGVCGCIFECTPDECSKCGVTFSQECPCCDTKIVVLHESPKLEKPIDIKKSKTPTQSQKIPSVDCDFPIETFEVPRAIFEVSYHDELWYKCPHCQRSFEAHHAKTFVKSLHNDDVRFCPYCRYGFVLC